MSDRASASGLDGEQLAAAARALRERIVDNRRRIHRQPELGLDNPLTQELIVAELVRIGIRAVRKGKRCSSVVADITGTGQDQGRASCVALRADTDALPLTENNQTDWGSQFQGRMHACGHDAHVAMLLGAAEILNSNRASFAGTVRLLFQPGEEGYGGAKIMIQEGALEGVDAAFALHVEPSQPAGSVLLRNGTILASDDSFSVEFQGSGGHASMPHHTHDPIPAIGPFVDGLSHAAARETDPDDRVVYSVTRVRAGTAGNVVPPTAKCSGTVRSLSPAGRQLAHERLRRIAEGVAASRGLQAQVKIHRGYSPTVNHAGAVHGAAESARQLGLPTVWMPSALMGAEDFSYILEAVPGAMAFLGASVTGGGPLHSDLMQLDEDVLPSGAALHVATALRLLADGTASAGSQ